MNQTEAREFAKELTEGTGVVCVATQESRHHGRRAKPGEPWIVVMSGNIVFESREAVS